MHFDEEKNRIIIEVEGKVIEIVPQEIRDLLPFKDKHERVKDLIMIIHDVEREELTQIETFIKECKKIDKALSNCETNIKGAPTIRDLKKQEALIKLYLARKNALAEVRRAVALLEKKKTALRVRIAKLETSGEE